MKWVNLEKAARYKRLYSQLSLFTVVTFYKVTENTQLANTAPLLHCSWGNTRLCFCEHLAGHIFANQSIHDLPELPSYST